MAGDWEIDFLAPDSVRSANRRFSNPYQHQKWSNTWKHAAFVWALGNRNEGALPKLLDQATIRITLPVRTPKGRRDPSNFMTTTKPIIDGFVQAKIFVDDDQDHLLELPPLFHRGNTVRVQIWKGFLL